MYVFYCAEAKLVNSDARRAARCHLSANGRSQSHRVAEHRAEGT